MEQLALVSTGSEIRPTMASHEFINHKLKFDLNNPYIPTIEKEIMSMLDDKDGVTDNELIEEVDNVQIGDVVDNKSTGRSLSAF